MDMASFAQISQRALCLRVPVVPLIQVQYIRETQWAFSTEYYAAGRHLRAQLVSCEQEVGEPRAVQRMFHG